MEQRHFFHVVERGEGDGISRQHKRDESLNKLNNVITEEEDSANVTIGLLFYAGNASGILNSCGDNDGTRDGITVDKEERWNNIVIFTNPEDGTNEKFSKFSDANSAGANPHDLA